MTNKPQLRVEETVKQRYSAAAQQHQQALCCPIEYNLTLTRGRIEVLQINVGKLCNQICVHCHVDAGPGRKEIMSRQTMDWILDWLAQTEIQTVDITGGAPEIIPNFRYLVEAITALAFRRHIIDRCNLTVFFEPGQEDLAEFMARHKVEIIASLPCYSPEKVDCHYILCTTLLANFCRPRRKNWKRTTEWN